MLDKFYLTVRLKQIVKVLIFCSPKSFHYTELISAKTHRFYAVLLAIFGYLGIVSFWDADVLQIDHFFTLIVSCGVLLKLCDSMKKDEV